jgi:pimeloyl-ACP methyl ester carboxylesterase
MPEPLRTQHHLDTFELSVIGAGPVGGEPVLFLHGLPTGAELWRSVLTAFAEAGFRGLAPDLPGYGLTRIPPVEDHSLAGAAELLAAWLRHDGLGPVWVVGHDLGGGVAQLLATRHPDLVGRLSLTNAVSDGTWPVPPVRLLIAAARAGTYPWLVRLRLFPNPYLRHELDRAFADPERVGRSDRERVFWDGKVSTAAGRQAFARHLAATARVSSAVAADLAGLDVPSQIVWGGQDPFQPWDGAGRTLRDLLPDPEVSFLHDSGHFTPLEQPAGLADHLLSWRSRK